MNGAVILTVGRQHPWDLAKHSADSIVGLIIDSMVELIKSKGFRNSTHVLLTF